MTYDPSCKHDQGLYLCDSPNDPDYWLRWCCAKRCGHSYAKHPLTGLSYPRNPVKEVIKKLPPLSEGGKH